jgi:outer membrane receptor protein involved in Fe transport
MKSIVLLSASATALLAAMPSYAQEQSAQTVTQSSAQADDEEPDRVVVTGSRIARNDYVAESPIVTLDEETIESLGPTSLARAFNQMPQFAASDTMSTSSPARQGRNNANLRGLGIQRTLVLLDGRRMQPSDALGAIDMNSISPSLIQNVEIITGGASAVYGSDAIAGVVNFKLNRDFKGFEVDVQYGETERSDAAATQVGITMGSSFDEGRGKFVASLSYFNRERANRSSREFFSFSGIASALQGGAYVSNATNLPTQAALNQVFAGYGVTGTPARNASIGVNPNNTLFTTAVPVLNLSPNLPYIVFEDRVGSLLGRTYPLQTPIERYTAFFNASYDLSDTVEAYVQVNHMEYDSSYSRGGWSGGSTAPLALIPVTNPFVPADLRTILASRPNPNTPFNFTFSTSRIGDTKYEFGYDLNEFMVGFRGELGRDWTWDIYGSYGTTAASETTSGWVNVAGWNTLINAADGGASICPGGFNPFLAQSLENTPGQEACFNYLNRTLRETTDFTQQIVEASLQGGLFELPAGQVRFAAGAGYRRQTYDYRPPGERVRNEVWPVQITGAASGSYDVYEGYGEVFIPVLKDIPFIKELNVDLAYRYSDYNLVGGVNTYKGSLDWAFFDSLRMRAGYQRAIRGPSLGELFSPPERASSGIGSTASGAGDPCDFTGRLRNPALNPNTTQVRALCIAQGVPTSVIDIFRFAGSSVSGIASGNTGLKEETADTITAGFVWTSKFDSPWISGLTASIDYYDINVEDAIGVITAQVGLSRCFNSDGQSNPTYDPSNFFCQLTTRNVSGGIETQRQPTLNLAAYEVAGIDFQVDWDLDLGELGLSNAGQLSFNLVLSNLLDYKIQNLGDAPFLDYAGTIGNAQIDSGAIGFPEWKASLTAGYHVGPFGMSAAYRWYASMTNAADVGVTTPGQPGVDAADYLDLSATWDFDQGTVLRAGVQNVFDAEPPAWTGNGATDLALYDLLQRRFYVGLKHRF